MKKVLIILAILLFLMACFMATVIYVSTVVASWYPQIKSDESYTTETNWGPLVQSVGPCWMPTRYNYTCWVKREGMDPERLSMNLLPGRMVQVGERIGVYYKIGDTVVESYTVRDGYPNRMFHRDSCYKSESDCYWPSKK
jgi:hypothetical protein